MPDGIDGQRHADGPHDTHDPHGPDRIDPLTASLVEAILPHVPFDGWSPTALRAALAELKIDPALARACCPRGPIDLAIAFHHRADRQMAADLRDTDLHALRLRERVAYAVRHRLHVAAPHKEAIRRAAALFALPHHAGDGGACLWHTAHTIWTALGDTSNDLNWYTKRLTLAAVYGATVVYWLGDTSPGARHTAAFLERRIDNVMQLQKARGAFARPALRWGRGRARR